MVTAHLRREARARPVAVSSRLTEGSRRRWSGWWAGGERVENALRAGTAGPKLRVTVLAVIAHRLSWTNASLVAAGWPAGGAQRLAPAEALARLGPADVALGRLDVLEDLGGIEDGSDALEELAGRGVVVLNGATSLRCTHDKLRTAAVLARSGIPHPSTRLLIPGADPDLVETPVVVKPRFGSWGREVVLCRGREQLGLTLAALRDRPWFRAQGALLQELVPPRGYDLRVLVAGGRVVGAAERRAAPGEWRTNVTLGGTRHPVVPPADACELALQAAAASGADLVGVDLLPSDDGWVVVELNGAVDFTRDYARADVFAAVRDALVARAVAERPPDILAAAGG